MAAEVTAQEETAQLTQQIELNKQQPEYGSDEEDDAKDTKQHFIIIHVGYGEGFTPIFENEDESKRDYSDPFCEVFFVTSGKQTMKTHVQFECQDWNPKWTEYEKFFLSPNPDEFPQVISVNAYDKSDKASKLDAMYGQYHINCADERIFDKPGNCFDRIIDLNSS